MTIAGPPTRNPVPPRVTILPMSRPLRSPATLLSTVLCLALAALWLRSYLPETLLWESRGGRLLLIADSRCAAAMRQARETQTLENFLAARLNPVSYPTPPVERRLLGFYFAHGTNPWEGTIYIFGVPYWFLVPLAGLPLLFHRRRHRLDTRRRAATLCPVCGYDCRATPDRCPECGTIPA
jgi:hypothetical protein